MTLNSTVSYLVLGSYLQVGSLRYLFFLLTAALYMSIVCANVLLILVICMNRSLHEPMYVFLCSLFVNELYGSTGLFPFLLIQLLSDLHLVSSSLCFLQIFCLYSYASVEVTTLAAMSYDRYLAICRPLRYHTRMTCRRAAVLIGLLWFYSFVRFLVTVSLNMRLVLCANVIDSLYCHNFLVVKLACSNTTDLNIYGLFGLVLTILVPLLPILFSYAKILGVCFSGSKQTRQKAVSTCAPQLVALLNFSVGCCLEILRSRIRLRGVPQQLRLVLSLYFLLIQPLLSPVMFGLQMSTIRQTCKRMMFAKHTTTTTTTETSDRNI